MQTYVELLPKYINITEKEFKAHSIKYLNNSKVGGIKASHIFVLPNGAELSIDRMKKISSTSCNMYTNYKTKDGKKASTYFNICSRFYVDVNGFDNPPNTFGKDVFRFNLVLDGILPHGMPQEEIWCEKFDECGKKDSIYSVNCTAWVVINKNMDYIRCPGKIGWDKDISYK